MLCGITVPKVPYKVVSSDSIIEQSKQKWYLAVGHLVEGGARAQQHGESIHDADGSGTSIEEDSSVRVVELLRSRMELRGAEQQHFRSEQAANADNGPGAAARTAIGATGRGHGELRTATGGEGRSSTASVDRESRTAILQATRERLVWSRLHEIQSLKGQLVELTDAIRRVEIIRQQLESRVDADIAAAEELVSITLADRVEIKVDTPFADFLKALIVALSADHVST